MKCVILTGLPFRKYGNQSLIRFVLMFLDRGDNLHLFSSGSDRRGEHAVDHKNIACHGLCSVLERGFYKIYETVISFSKLKQASSGGKNKYLNILSVDKMPPFSPHSNGLIVRRWVYYILNIADNIIIVIWLMLTHFLLLWKCDVVIGYECHYALSAKIISKLFGKVYINKYQGTILATTNRRVRDCKKYYPYFYYGINKSDLCLMVNDGTDGEYYADIRGCSNIFCHSHGVAVSNYLPDEDLSNISFLEGDRFNVLNLASGSSWKRVDRLVRIASMLPREIRKKVLFSTTYFGEDKQEIRSMICKLGVEDCVQLVEGLSAVQCNAALRKSDLLLSVNDISNLGNPVLEAIYYGIPVMTIANKSIYGFLHHDIDAVCLNLDDSFDKMGALYIEKMVNEKSYYNQLKENMIANKTVNPLQIQQNKEYAAIQAIVR